MLPSRRMGRRASHLVRLVAFFLGLAGTAPELSRAERLQPKTVSAFEQYVQFKEACMNKEIRDGKPFLEIDGLPSAARGRAYADLKQGQIIIQRSDECGSRDRTGIPGGLIHDWTGIVFVPGVSLSQVLVMLQDYDHDVEYYKPDVLRSKLVARSGDDFQIYLRLKKVKVVAVVLDTEYAVHYAHLDAAHSYSLSYSTRIEEVENAGGPQERDRPVGDDHGFLWRLYSYWRFYQADNGVYLQCNVLSLTRDVPTGLGWLVQPFIENVPRESLRFTLNATRKALVTKFGESAVSSGAAGQAK